MKHVRGFFRRTEGLRVGRAQRHQAGLEALPHLRIGVGLLEIHVGERRDPLQVGQRRHVHDRQARQLRRGDLDHENADRVVGVLRLLHRKADHVVAREVDIARRHRVELAGQVAREDRPVHRFVAQLDAHFGTVTVDQLGGLGAANQGHVVARHQQLRAQQGTVGSPENQDVTRHIPSLGKFVRFLSPGRHPMASCRHVKRSASGMATGIMHTRRKVCCRAGAGDRSPGAQPDPGPLVPARALFPDCAEPVIGRRFTPIRWVHPGYAGLLSPDGKNTRRPVAKIFGYAKIIIIECFGHRGWPRR